MKKTLLMAVMASTLSYAEISTFVPYYGSLEYGDKGHRDKGKLYGFYASRGNLSYLLEFNYLHSEVNDKHLRTDTVIQDEFSLMYGRYFFDYAYKIGIHTNNTDDRDLKQGYTLTVGGSKWRWFGSDKLTYGVDIYNSYYPDAHNLKNDPMPIYLHQLTPYLFYSKALTSNSQNLLELKANLQAIPLFQSNSSYNSYEIKDTLSYKSFSLGAGFFTGQMRLGVKDWGRMVYNLKDIQTKGYSANVAYDITKKFNLNLSYITSEYEEYLSHFKIKNSALILATRYTF